MSTRPLFIFGSLVFSEARMCAIAASLATEGLVIRVGEDGTAEFSKESTGSIAGQDEYLYFVILWLPSAIFRLFRTGLRPALLEILLFAVAAVFTCIGYLSVGTDALRLTLNAAGDPWTALWLAANGVAVLAFLLLCSGWATPKRPVA